MEYLRYFLQIILYLSLSINLYGQEPDSTTVKFPDEKSLKISTIDSTTLSIGNIETDTIKISSENQISKPVLQYPPLKRDFKKLTYNTGLYLGVSVIAFGILWVMPESTTGWDKDDIRENGITAKWSYNVKAGPVFDEDDWVLNYITHPYSGAVYYMTARSCGFTVLESFTYSAIMSTFFWEYGIEAFAEIPSYQDLVITPVLGSVMGEGFYYAKKSILKKDKKILKSKFLGVTALILMDPFNTFLDAVGYKQKVKTEANITPVGFDYKSNSTIWGLNLSVTF
jgi:hypothetical protein